MWVNVRLFVTQFFMVVLLLSFYLFCDLSSNFIFLMMPGNDRGLVYLVIPVLLLKMLDFTREQYKEVVKVDHLLCVDLFWRFM